ANISFGQQRTLIPGNYNNPTSTKNSFTSQVVILASTSDVLAGILATDSGTPPPPQPGAPTLAAPAHNATNVSLNTSLSWNAVSNATSYHVQVSTASNFTNLVENTSNVNALTFSPTGLTYGT